MNEKRLIDANALLREIEEELSHECKVYTAEQNKFIDMGLRIAAKDIRHQPTVDAVEVAHGRWIWSEENECWVCSNCKMSALNNYRGNSVDSNYCPNCGAIMDGGKDDG